MTYPTLTWRRSGPLHSCLLERSKADAVLVAECVDSGDDSPENAAHRFGVRWLAGGVQDRAQVGALEDAKGWVRALVVARLCAL
jgi:hypothetical protein